MMLAFVLSLFLAAQPSTAVCESVTNDEVAALIGTVKSKRPIVDSHTCVWAGDQRTFSIVRTVEIEPESAAVALNAVRTRAQKDDVVRDEPGIGAQAVSEATARGKSVTIVAASGTTAWTIGVEHVYGGLKADELLPKLRAIARKLVH